MTLHYNTVSPLLREYLTMIMNNGVFDDFVLVGGTALSLQLGHRISEDIDLFTTLPYGDINLSELNSSLSKMFVYTGGIECLKSRNIGYTVYIGKNEQEKIKLDMFYMDDLIYPTVVVDGLRLASAQDIAAMKMQAITTSKRKKDFWDIHELLNVYTLEQLISYAEKRFPYSFEKEEALTSLYNLSELTQDTVVTCLRGKYWEFIMEDIRDTVKNYRDR